MSSALLTIVAVSLVMSGELAVSDLTQPLHDPHPIETQSMQIVTAEPPAAEVRAGDLAPDFSFQAMDGSWRRLHDLVWQGRVLLVFGAHERELRALEKDRERLGDLGVLPVAVLDMKSKAAAGLVQRLDLHYTVLSDPRGVIATQFNLVDNIAQRTLPAWFAVERTRRVRDLRRGGLPASDWVDLARRAFGLPLPGAALPAAR